MGGGGGLGLFVGTAGSRGTDAFAGGTLVAAATSTVSDAGGGSKGEQSTRTSNWYDGGLPIWMFPYGHPEHDRRMQGLEGLKPYLDGYQRAHDDWGILDGKSWMLRKAIEKLGKSQKEKKSKK